MTEPSAGESPQRTEASDEKADDRGSPVLFNPTLYFESKRKLLDLLVLFSEHGYVSLEEVASALGRTSQLMSSTESKSLHRQIHDLEEALRAERLGTELAAWDLAESERALASERGLVQESLVRIGSLEGQLRDARRTTLKLIAASRNSLSTLKRVRDHLARETYAAGALTPLVQNFQELTQVVQELHVLATVRTPAAGLSIAPR